MATTATPQQTEGVADILATTAVCSVKVHQSLSDECLLDDVWFCWNHEIVSFLICA